MTALGMDTDEASLGRPTLWGRREAAKRGLPEINVRDGTDDLQCGLMLRLIPAGA